MIYECYGCDWTGKDDLPEVSAGDLMIQYLEGKGLAAHCPECGAVVAPRNISSEDITGWFRLFSRCPNAMCCIQEANCYRAECERLVFYPGCLTFLWRAGEGISRGIQQVLSLEKDHK